MQLSLYLSNAARLEAKVGESGLPTTTWLEASSCRQVRVRSPGHGRAVRADLFAHSQLQAANVFYGGGIRRYPPKLLI